MSDKNFSAFIPVHKKDISILPLTIRSIRRWALPRIDKITIVASLEVQSLLSEYLKSERVDFIDEDKVIPGLPLSAMPKLVMKGENRKGWLFQQFLKYGSSAFAAGENYLIVDSDCILLRPTKFIDHGKFIFYLTRQYHLPYFKTYADIFGYQPKGPSFISDFMVFNVSHVHEVIKAIESRKADKWHQAIIKIILSNPVRNSFCEYETYGNYLLKHHPGEMICIPDKATALPRRYAFLHPFIRPLLALRYNTISYHSYDR